jgi:hypothetical protein
VLKSEDVEFAVKGGSVLACGGGGAPEHGRELGHLAVTIGRPELVTMEEVDDNAWIATAAAIGAPDGMDSVTAVRLLQEALGAPLYGLMSAQNGVSSTVNAWLPAAVLGLKVIDAVGDVRAHPTGDMGSIGLNPVAASYVRQHAALGGISIALELGMAITDAEPRGAKAILDAICTRLSGEIILTGKVREKNLQYTSEAFDVGQIHIDCGAQQASLHVMNEYMAVECSGDRLATYPDVITTFSTDGVPISAGSVEVGMELHVLRVAKQYLPLSSSITDPSVYPIVDKTLGIDISTYALAPRV